MQKLKTIRPAQILRLLAIAISMYRSPVAGRTGSVTRCYCENDLRGEWFAHDPDDPESLGDCYY